MNKWHAILLSACLLQSAMTLPNAASAAAAEKPVRVFLDGKLIKFEAPPLVEDGTTLVQFRPIFEKLGLRIGWNEETQTVTGTRDDLTINLIIDDTDAYVNDRPTELELPPRLVDGNTFVPLRFVGEASGKEVTWNEKTSTVYLRTPKGTGKTPDPSKPVKGEYAFPDGTKYTGQLVNGYPEGTGKLYDEKGKLLFEGTMSGGLPGDGRSRSYYDNGQLEFNGTVKDGVWNGAVKQYTSSGSLMFDGTYVNGEREKGTLYDDTGDKYTGPFDNDLPNGTGKIMYKSGDVYEGEVVDGVREGKGTYTTTKGEKVVGEFKNNALNGLVSHYDRKGTLLSVSEYSNDVLISKVDMTDGSSPLPNTITTTQPAPLKIENERHDKAVSLLRDRYNQNKKQVEDQIAQIRKNNPGTYATKAAYDKALKDANAKQEEIIDKMSSLPLDNSKATEAARAELEKQLFETQELIAQIIAKGSVQQQIQTLRDQLALLRDSYTADLKRENEQHAEMVKKLK
ncbi:stalk domain-containing protein [Paenibacillus allorhizosphaerae]|uniref:Copper amine oxidase-like N-terminal domain-containing protein n=1 Tax=Paenibacillus allorhizosphaerae TaxID=2849866 RepID=A0ABM8VQA3_9BACL|nr:stalk domain-containing protein [Paenibacillus allorhizosphaerae]CAG7653899.1 hypothetical protein PAECIP111802_05615 [Paenibacillus allorhizosphaerae]